MQYPWMLIDMFIHSFVLYICPEIEFAISFYDFAVQHKLFHLYFFESSKKIVKFEK